MFREHAETVQRLTEERANAIWAERLLGDCLLDTQTQLTEALKARDEAQAALMRTLAGIDTAESMSTAALANHLRDGISQALVALAAGSPGGCNRVKVR